MPVRSGVAAACVSCGPSCRLSSGPWVTCGALSSGRAQLRVGESEEFVQGLQTPYLALVARPGISDILTPGFLIREFSRMRGFRHGARHEPIRGLYWEHRNEQRGSVDGKVLLGRLDIGLGGRIMILRLLVLSPCVDEVYI